MAAPAAPFGPLNTFLHAAVRDADNALTATSAYADVVGADNVIVGLDTANFGTNRVGNVISLGDVGQTPNTIEQGYLGDDTADSVGGAPGRPPVAVTIRLDPAAAINESHIGTTYIVAVSRKKGTEASIKAFQAELSGYVESTPDGGIVQAVLTFAPQGANVSVFTP